MAKKVEVSKKPLSRWGSVAAGYPPFLGRPAPPNPPKGPSGVYTPPSHPGSASTE